MKMLDKLQAVEDRYLDLEAKISDPEVIANQPEWQKATKAHALEKSSSSGTACSAKNW